MMNFEMVEYIFEIGDCEKRKRNNGTPRPFITNNIENVRWLHINDTMIDIGDYTDVKVALDPYDLDMVRLIFYTYPTIADEQELVLETEVRTKLSTLETFMAL